MPTTEPSIPYISPAVFTAEQKRRALAVVLVFTLLPDSARYPSNLIPLARYIEDRIVTTDG